jgi:hypothetical protein
VEDWTPVNEPLTTARFSTLYGHWYPHRTDSAAMARALLVQTRATVRAMEEIRRVIPGARLVQTEDLGRTTGTSTLWNQVEFENHRRWLSLDLLFGHVGPGHPLHAWLVELGVPLAELETLAARPCPPDVVGLNYYVTSDRWLDERLELYPDWSHGGNGRQSYADLHTTLGHPRDFFGHRAVLSSAWDRYRTPWPSPKYTRGATGRTSSAGSRRRGTPPCTSGPRAWRCGRSPRGRSSDRMTGTVSSSRSEGITSLGCSTSARPRPGPPPWPGCCADWRPRAAGNIRCSRPRGGGDRPLTFRKDRPC